MMIDWGAMLPPPGAAETVAETLPASEAPPIAPAAPGLPLLDSREDRWGDLRPCTACANLRHDGRCLAAVRGEIAAVRTYSPCPDIPRRCDGFSPLPDDLNERAGRER